MSASVCADLFEYGPVRVRVEPVGIGGIELLWDLRVGELVYRTAVPISRVRDDSDWESLKRSALYAAMDAVSSYGSRLRGVYDLLYERAYDIAVFNQEWMWSAVGDRRRSSTWTWERWILELRVREEYGMLSAELRVDGLPSVPLGLQVRTPQGYLDALSVAAWEACAWLSTLLEDLQDAHDAMKKYVFADRG